MNPLFRAVPFLAAAATALCLSSSAVAQDASASPAGGDMHHHDPDHAAWRKAHEERRARFLHDILNIKSDQESAFQTFLADMKPQPGAHGDWREHRDGKPKDPTAPPMTTPERLDQMAAFMAKHTAERQAAFQHRADAIKRFYAVLGPEQKRAFDALHAMHDGPHGGHHDWEGPGGDRHDGGPGDDHGHGEEG